MCTSALFIITVLKISFIIDDGYTPNGPPQKHRNIMLSRVDRRILFVLESVAPERMSFSYHTIARESAGFTFFQSQHSSCTTMSINRFGKRFHDGQYSLVIFCLLFFYSRCPHAEPFVKVGACPPPVRYVTETSKYMYNAA